MHSNVPQFDVTKKITKKKIQQFADLMIEISEQAGFKMSSRGWAYICEQRGMITKDQFDKVESAINRCRKEGYLPVDFTADDAGREFEGVEKPDEGTVKDTLRWMMNNVLDGHRYYTPNWWKDEEYYIQMVVEKIDLKTLFEPVCAEYHIPIANSKGWNSINSRAEYSRRFKQAEDMGLKCVLLYMGDHDPDGLRISDTMRKNLFDIKDIVWEDGETGYDPTDLIIDRFGLNYDFIIEQQYTWIQGLMTGGNKDLSDPKHHNHNLPYVQNYLKKIGARKCEANVVVTTPDLIREFCRENIERYLGVESKDRFAEKRRIVEEEYYDSLDKSGLTEPILKVLHPEQFEDEQ